MKDNLSKKGDDDDDDDDKLEDVKGTRNAFNIDSAKFRVVSAVLGEGAILAQKAQNSPSSMGKKKHNSASNLFDTGNSFSIGMGDLMQELDDSAGAMGNRATYAAIDLNKFRGITKPKRVKTLNSSKSNQHHRGKKHTDVGFPSAQDVQPLPWKCFREWVDNVDTLLVNTTGTTAQLPIDEDSLTSLANATDAGILEGTTAILASLIRRHKRKENVYTAKDLKLSKQHETSSKSLAGTSFLSPFGKKHVEKSTFASLSQWELEAFIVVLLAILLYYTLQIFHWTVRDALLLTFLSIIAAVLLLRTRNFINQQSDQRILSDNIILPDLPDNYLQRKKTVTQIVNALLDKNSAPLVVVADDDADDPSSHTDFNNVTILNGPSGVGKTSLAIMTIRNQKIRHHFRDGIVWLSLSGRDGLSYSDLIYYYKDVYTQLQDYSSTLSSPALDVEQYYLSPEDEQDAKELMEDLRKQIISHLDVTEKRILLVLDGVENVGDLKWFQFLKHRGGQMELGARPPPPPRYPFQILITTADHMDGQLVGSKTIQVGVLTEAEAIELLENEAGETVDESIAREVVQGCAHLPLTVRCIARILTSRNLMEKRGALAFDKQCWEKIDRDLNAHCFNPYEEQKSFHSFLNLCFSCICTDPAITEVLKLCYSAFALVFPNNSNHQPVPLRMVYLLWEELFQTELISNYQILAIEQYLVSSSSSGDDEKKGEILSRCGFVCEQLETLGLISALRFERKKKRIRGIYISHESLRRSWAHYLETEGRKRNEFSTEQFWVGLLVEGHEFSSLYEELLKGEESVLSEVEETFLLRHLPEFMLRAGLPNKAAKLLVNNRFIKKRLEQLDLLKGTKQHIIDAEALIHIVRQKEELNGENSDSVNIVSAENNVILAFERVADHILLRLHFGSGKEHSSPPTFVGMLLYALGLSLRKQERTNEAFMLYEESLTALKSTVSSDERYKNVNFRIMSRVLYAIGFVYYKKAAYDASIKSLTESLHLAKSASATGRTPKRADIGRTLHVLGCAYFSRGDNDDALQAYKKAIRVRMAITGVNHADVAQTLFNIGIIHHEMGNSDEAIKKMSEALHVRKKVLGDDHVDVARTLQRMGTVYRQLEEAPEAIVSYQQALHIWKKLLKTDKKIYSVYYAECMHNLGVMYRQEGRLDEAMVAYEEALRVRKAVLGPNDINVAQTLHNIGIVHCEKGNHDDAIHAYAQALRVRQQLIGEEQSEFAVAQTLHNIGVVLRQRGDTDEAMVAFSEALWAAKALDIEPPSVEALRERCCVLFGPKILNAPCVSSRIFACASLMVDCMIKQEYHGSGTNPLSNDEGATTLMHWIRPIFPLLTAFVEAEMAVIEGHNEDYAQSIRSEKNPFKIQFCAFDFASVRTPVDLIVGSNDQLERCIHAIQNIFEEVDLLCRNESETREEDSSEKKDDVSNSELAQMLLVFHAMASRTTGAALRGVCAEAMPRTNNKIWPAIRFISAAEQYKAELEAIVAFMESRSEYPNVTRPSTTPLRVRLSTIIGSAIRFHLRRLFDPTPFSYTIPCDAHPFVDLSDCRSKTHEIVEMAPPDDVSDTEEESKLWEAPISYVLNYALRKIHLYYSLDSRNSVEEQRSRDSMKPAKPFSLSQVSKRMFQEGSSTTGRAVLDSDMEDILDDIYVAQTILGAFRASTFVITLFRWPGVETAIKDAGGWRCIESLSNIILRHHLDKDSPDESHYMLLNNVGRFIGRLEMDLELLADAEQVSQNILEKFWKRFKRAGSKKKQNTNEGIIHQALVDGSSNLVFPSLIIPEYYEEFENESTS